LNKRSRANQAADCGSIEWFLALMFACTHTSTNWRITAQTITGQLFADRPQPDTIAHIDNSAPKKNTATLRIVFMSLLRKLSEVMIAGRTFANRDMR
jgi:hypothetical protein